MAVISSTTRVGGHGTPMKPYGSFAGKAQEGGNPMVMFMLMMANQYNGGLTTKGKK